MVVGDLLVVLVEDQDNMAVTLSVGPLRELVAGLAGALNGHGASDLLPGCPVDPDAQGSGCSPVGGFKGLEAALLLAIGQLVGDDVEIPFIGHGAGIRTVGVLEVSMFTRLAGA